ncbi:MAG: hypothetical protein ACHWZW_02705 [Spirulina sp.]
MVSMVSDIQQIMNKLDAIQLESAELRAELAALRQQLMVTRWVKGRELARLMKQSPRWPEVWRNNGLFTEQEGAIRNVGSKTTPRYEYHVGRCKELWDWWGNLSSDAKRSFSESKNRSRQMAAL